MMSLKSLVVLCLFIEAVSTTKTIMKRIVSDRKYMNVTVFSFLPCFVILFFFLIYF
jgi:hypothetical protein